MSSYIYNRREFLHANTLENSLTVCSCFVFFSFQGCDASILITSNGTNTAEKDAQENLALPADGFDTVIRAKEAVEAVCPNVVSCADIFALATRDVIVLVRLLIRVYIQRLYVRD